MIIDDPERDTFTSSQRKLLIDALLARGVPPSVADQIRVVEDDSNSVRDLTPTKAEKLIAMFGGMIQKYGAALHGDPVPAPRIVTAQRPFWERYRYKQHNGVQEMARRRKRIEAITGRWGKAPLPDMLFVQSDGTRLHLNSHGEVCRFYS